MSHEEYSEDWIREALASLDRPEMPDDVARRLDAAIAGAQVPEPRQQATPVVVPKQSTGEHPHPARRRSWLIGAAGVAAAMVAVALVNPLAPAPTTSPGVTDVAAPQASSTASPSADGPASPRPAPTATESAVAEVLMASQTTYTEQTLPEQVLEVAELEGQGEEPSQNAALNGQWAEVAEMPAATTRGAAACVAALPQASDDLIFVDRAKYENQPVLVVARRAGGQIEVFVLAAGCTATDTAVLLRATVEAP